MEQRHVLRLTRRLASLEAGAILIALAGITLAGSSDAGPPAAPPSASPSARPGAGPPPSAAPSSAPVSSVSVAPPPVSSAVPLAPLPSAEEAKEQEIAQKKQQARAHFERGVELFSQNLHAPALAEFLRSREIYPTRSATKNAATCLRQLERFDEALDMLEAFLREFSDAPPREKESAQLEVAELRTMLGTINVDGAEVGASIFIDGKNRAEYPSLAPLRVSAGSHTVRVFKEGFEPYEGRVDVAGGQTARVQAKLKPLLTSGRLRVLERGGASVEVIVDGVAVGKTPWEGAVAVGAHAIYLRGEGIHGSQPAQASIDVQKLTSLTLAVEPLPVSISVDATPAGATIAVDSVSVGHGLWDGRLRAGSHQIEVTADGFLPTKREVSLKAGTREVVKISLERDPDDPRFRQPSRVVLEGALRFGISPTFGGDVAGGCSGACSGGPGLGVNASAYAGYELGTGFGFGVSVGYLFAEQHLAGRAVSLTPQGLSSRVGAADETLRVAGATLGVAASYHLDQKFPMLFRLGVGGVFGSTGAQRSAVFPAAGGGVTAAYRAPEIVDSRRVNQLYLAPEVRVGVRPWEKIELSAGLAALILVSPSAPKWGDDEPRPVLLPDDGYSTYPAESLTGTVYVILAPGLSGRIEF